MASAALVGGVSLVAIGCIGRFLLRNRAAIMKATKSLPGVNISKYYRGKISSLLSSSISFRIRLI